MNQNPNHRQQQRQHHLRQQIARLRGQQGRGNPATQPGAMAPPFDPLADQAIAGYAQNRDNTMLDIANQRSSLTNQYGFGQDASVNPYALANQLSRSLEVGDKTSTNSYAAKGQLYAGSLSNALGENRYQYGRSYNDLRNRFDAGQQKLDRAGFQAQADYQDQAYQARQNSIQDALSQDPDPSLAPPRVNNQSRIRQLQQQLARNRQRQNSRTQQQRSHQLNQNRRG